MKLRNFLLEGEDHEDSEPIKYSKHERNAFLEACKGYSNYKESFQSSKDLKKQIEEIGWIVETAEHMTLQETEDWFDSVTVTRHMKQLRDAYKILGKTGEELIQMQQRFESAYEDIGEILGKYYKV